MTTRFYIFNFHRRGIWIKFRIRWWYYINKICRLLHLFICIDQVLAYNCLCRKKFCAHGIFKLISSSTSRSKYIKSSSVKVRGGRLQTNNNIWNHFKVGMTYYFTKVISLQFALCCAFSQGYVIDNSVGKNQQ